jgi:hypothetical protein
VQTTAAVDTDGDGRQEQVSGKAWFHADEAADWMEGLASLRADAVAGDPRLVQLAWVVGVACGAVADGALEPVPGPVARSAGLLGLAEFFALDPDLVEAAFGPVEAPPPERPLAEVEAAVRALPEEEKVRLLVRLHQGEPGVTSELRGRCRRRSERHPPPTTPRRSAGDLRRLAAARAQTRRDAEEARRAAERQRRMATLSARGEAAWREVEALVAQRTSASYAQAAALLRDLRDLAEDQADGDAFGRRIEQLRIRHARKGGFLRRLTFETD